MYFNQQLLSQRQREKNETNILFKNIQIAKLITKKRLHLTTVLCWLSMILIGTSLIGLSTSLTEFTFQHCQPTETFCTKLFQIGEQTELFFYIILDGFNQNNRMFMDSYSVMQLQGQIGNKYHCGNYYTYGQLKKQYNAGGYRVPGTTNAHPCGEVMLNIFNDSIYLVNSDGGTPNLDSGDLVSQYNLEYKFIRLSNYQLSQWTDVQSTLFVNHFTIPYTSKKYILLGRAILPADRYQLIIKNSYPTKEQFSKNILVTQVNSMGIRDPLIGFYLFFWGIFVLVSHIFLCCYNKQPNDKSSSHKNKRQNPSKI